MRVAAIRLSPIDNVAVTCRDLRPGEQVDIDGSSLTITEAIDLGHKIAMSPLQAGDRIVKYGMPIGSATADVPAGGWVHTHNMQRDYIQAHPLDAAADRQ